MIKRIAFLYLLQALLFVLFPIFYEKFYDIWFYDVRPHNIAINVGYFIFLVSMLVLVYIQLDSTCAEFKFRMRSCIVFDQILESFRYRNDIHGASEHRTRIVDKIIKTPEYISEYRYSKADFLCSLSQVPIFIAYGLIYGRGLILIFGILSVCYWVWQKYWKIQLDECQKLISKSFESIYGVAYDLVSGLSVLKRYNAIVYFDKRMQPEVYSIEDSLKLFSRLNIRLSLALSFLPMIGFAMLFGLKQFGSVNLSVGAFIGTIGLLHRLFLSVDKLNLLINAKRTYSTDMERILPFEDVKSIGYNHTNSLVLSGLHCKFGNHVVLNDFNYSIEENSKVCLVGSSGKGKSTLLKIIAGQITDYSGDINFPSSYSSYVAKGIKMVSYAEQDPVIFTDTLIRNVTLGEESLVDEAMPLIELLGISSLLFDNRIIQKSNISGGQAQRIHLIRTLIRKSPVMLLDEPTSSLDSMNESIVSELISNYKGIVIFTTHRSTLESAANHVLKL